MSGFTATTPLCGHCGRPIVGGAVYTYGGVYHLECTQSPYPGHVFTAGPPTPIGCICPPTSEQTCQRVDCPRKAIAQGETVD
jgi:hypothetical protein